jgi:hypothetical protein
MNFDLRIFLYNKTKETEDKNATPETDLQDSILKLFQNEPTQGAI